MLGKDKIAAMIPHAGTMCLLDTVLEWDTTKIRCVSHNHHHADNPMLIDGQLPAMCGVEYAAQAMAVHGGLSGIVGGKPRAGYLAGLRDVVCHAARLDDIAGDLIVEAEHVMGDDSLAIYQFVLRVGETLVLQGRATVVMDVDGSLI